MSESLADVVHEAVERAKADDGQQIDPAKIMERHRMDEDGWCDYCGGPYDAPCDAYRLAELLIAERAALAAPYRVQPPASSLRPMSSQAEPDWSNGVHP